MAGQLQISSIRHDLKILWVDRCKIQLCVIQPYLHVAVARCLRTRIHGADRVLQADEVVRVASKLCGSAMPLRHTLRLHFQTRQNSAITSVREIVGPIHARQDHIDRAAARIGKLEQLH